MSGRTAKILTWADFKMRILLHFSIPPVALILFCSFATERRAYGYFTKSWETYVNNSRNSDSLCGMPQKHVWFCFGFVLQLFTRPSHWVFGAEHNSASVVIKLTETEQNWAGIFSQQCARADGLIILNLFWTKVKCLSKRTNATAGNRYVKRAMRAFTRVAQ